MMSVHFTDVEVIDFGSAATGNNDYFKQFFHGLLEEGVYLPPSAFETWFVSNAHDNEVIERTLTAVEKVVSRLN